MPVNFGTNADTAPARRILILMPGPNYRLSATMEKRLSMLSREFSGIVLTTSNKAWKAQVCAFEVIAIREGNGRISGLFRYLIAVRDLVRRAKEGRQGFELIVTYDPLRSGLVATIARRWAGAKVICELNGDYADPANYMDVASALARYLKRSLYVQVARFVLSRVNGIKILYEKQLAALDIQNSTQIVRRYPNLVNTQAFVNSGEKQTILSVGFPMYVKGMDVLIESFRRISGDIPGWGLVIVGYYPNKADFDVYIQGHPAISVIDPVPQHKLAEIVGECGMFVLASRTEAMGRVLVEAMAAAKPRIGTSVGGIPTIIEHNMDGILVEPGNVNQLADAILVLARDQDLRRRLGESARNRVKELFDPEAWWRETRSHYLAVCDAGVK